ncbi:Transcriptional regulator, TetR family [Devosia sp. LC5]|uniref:TetR/AcrR family transcriptional regulator n=1 Tax=Devosia sp. LC5 TaxID=1502724 RepID=UPI0004E3B80F|nr:TetR/AcrR family transcriptional regulator [Devosia sp. LC5]KFC62010.1 Transcriptional regulator, TetR family [Devosia sp. LC5]
MKSLTGLSLPEAVLSAAIPTFIDGGYDNTSMDEIAARAGTTKRTVYAHFGSKEQLFRAAIASAVEFFHSQLPPFGATDDPAAELEAFAARFVDLSTTWERAVRLQRIAMGEAKRFPDLAQLLHRDVIERTERIVADYLLMVVAAKHPGVKERSLDWALAMAALFLNMATGAQRFAALLQMHELIPGPPGSDTSPKVDRDRIDLAVRVFLSGFYAELGR